MRDEVDLVLASIVDADLIPPSASMLRLLCSTQLVKMTPARMCLIQSAFKPGKSFRDQKKLHWRRATCCHGDSK